MKCPNTVAASYLIWSTTDIASAGVQIHARVKKIRLFGFILFQYENYLRGVKNG